MSLVAKLAESLQRFDRRMWPQHRVVLTSGMRSVLAENRLIVADVGSASGPEPRWLELTDYIHFLTFEPVEREGGAAVALPNTTNFKTGLGAEKSTAVLRMMKDTDASTLRWVNEENIGDFA